MANGPMDWLMDQSARRRAAAYQAGQDLARRQMNQQNYGSVIPSGGQPATQQTPQQPSTQPEKPEDPDKGLQWSDLWSNPVTEAGMKVLDAGQKHISRPLAGLLIEQGIDPRYVLPWKGGLELIGAPQVGRDLQPTVAENVTPEQQAEIQTATSKTGKYRALMEGDLWNQLGGEAMFDPLNLVGFGLAGKGATALGASDDIVRTLNVGDDLLNRAQALPVTLPAKGVTKAAQKVLPNGLKLTPESTLLKGGAKTLGPMEDLYRRGIDPQKIEGSITRVAADDLAKTANEAVAAGNTPAYFNDLGTYDAITVFDHPLTTPATKAAAADDLVARGLAKKTRGRVTLTAKADAHRQLSDTLLAHQLGPDVEHSSHQMLDMYATALHLDNPRAFKTPDDVYKTFRIEASFDPAKGAGLDSSWNPAIDSPEVESLITRMAPKESIESFLTKTWDLNPKLEDWYPIGAEVIYHGGFDWAPMFSTPQQIDAVMANPEVIKLMERFNLPEAQVRARLQTLPKIDGILALIGSTSIKTPPDQNLVRALRGYKSLLDTGTVISTNTLTGKQAIPMGAQQQRAYLSLIHPDGLLSMGYLDDVASEAKRADKISTRMAKKPGVFPVEEGASFDIYPTSKDPETGLIAQPNVTGIEDKMVNYADNFKGNVLAIARYYDNVAKGMAPQQAAEILRADRAAIRSYTHDVWNKRLLLDPRQYIDPAAIRSGEIPLSPEWAPIDPKDGNLPSRWGDQPDVTSPEVMGKTIGARGQEVNVGNEVSWAASKDQASNEIFPYLTGRPSPITGRTADVVSPRAAEFGERMPNMEAFQARTWNLANLRNRASGAVLYSLRQDPNLLATIQKMGDDEMREWFARSVDDQLDAWVADGTAKRIADDSRNLRDYWQQPPTANTNIPAEYDAVRASVLTDEGYHMPDGHAVPYQRNDEMLAIDHIAQGDWKHALYQLADAQRTRGRFIPLGRRGQGPFLIQLTPDADVTTLPHEMSHLYRRGASPTRQRQISGAVSPLTRTSREGEESFAGMAENLMRTADSADPTVQATLDQFQHLADAVYVRGLPQGEFPEPLRREVWAQLEGTAKKRRMRAPTGSAPSAAATPQPQPAAPAAPVTAAASPTDTSPVHEAILRYHNSDATNATLDGALRQFGSDELEDALNQYPQHGFNRQIEEELARRRSPSVGSRLLAGDSLDQSYTQPVSPTRETAWTGQHVIETQQFHPDGTYDSRWRPDNPDIHPTSEITDPLATKVNPPVSPETEALINRPDVAILSAERATLSPPENLARTQQLQAELQARGAKVTPVLGHYGGTPEHSFIVEGITRADAMTLGRKYQQESILWTGDGIIYTDDAHFGHTVPKTGVEMFPNQADGYTTMQTPTGEVSFRYTLDDAMWPLDQSVIADDTKTAFAKWGEGEALLKRLKSQAAPRLTTEEAVAVANYGGMDSRDINRALRGLEEMTPELSDQIAKIDSAISKAPPLPEDTVVYRGFSAWAGKADLQAMVGRTLQERRFVSTSLVDGVARDFVRPNAPAMARITVPAGTQATSPYFAPLNNVIDEQELLLPRNTTFRVKDVSFRPWYGGRELAVLDLEVVPGATGDMLYQGNHLDGIPGDWDDLSQSGVADTVASNPQYSSSADPVRFAAPLDRASASEVVTQIGGEIRATPQAIKATTDLIEPLHAANPDHWQPVALWFQNDKYRPSVERMLQATDDAARRAAFNDLAADLNQTWQAMGVGLPGYRRRLWQAVNTVLPENRKIKPIAGGMGRSAHGSIMPDDVTEIVMDVAKRPEFQEFDTEFRSLTRGVEAIGEKLGLPFTDLSTMKDARRLYEMADNADKAVIEQFLKYGEIVDDNMNVPQIYAAGAADAWVRSAAKEIGYDLTKKPSGALVRELSKYRKAWTEQALFSPRYHFQNAADMTFKTVSEGYMPLIGDSVWTKAAKWNIPVPMTVANPRGVGQIGKVSGNADDIFASARAATGVEQVIPGAPGRVAGRGVQWSRGLANTMESSFRGWVWAGEIMQQMKPYQQTLLGEAKRLGVSETAIKRIEAMGIDMSADDITRVVAAAGDDPALGRQLGVTWEHGLRRASQRGEKAANRVHFDFLDERNIEKTLHIRTWAPFHFWATRNLPYYAQTLAQHPWMMRNWETWWSVTEEEREAGGLPSRFKMTAPIPGADKLLSTLFGPGQAYFNPLVVMSIADQMKPMYTDPDATIFSQISDAAGRVGLKPAPWIDIPLHAVGLYGDEKEPFGALRHSGLIESVTGATGHPIDIEAPGKAILRKIRGQDAPTSQREIFGIPVTGSQSLDYAISKRIAELSIEETGQPNHPAYTAAMADPSSPIYQRAEADARKTSLGANLYSMVSPIPMKYLPETEKAIRGRAGEVNAAKAGLTDEERKVLNQILGSNGDLATGYWKTTSDPREAQLQAGLDLAQRFMPNAAGRISRDRVMNQYPILAQYYAWLDTLPPGADRSPTAFLDSTS